MTIAYEIDEAHAGMRIDAFLASRNGTVSRARIQRAFEQDLILLNDCSVKKSELLKPFDCVRVVEGAFADRDIADIVPQDIPLEILYEDEFFLAVNKAPGMVVHPGNGNADGTLVNALAFHVQKLSTGSAPGRPGIVHRLDKDTSGVLVVAKTDDAHTRLASLFEKRAIVKQYVGFCIAQNLPLSSGSWLGPIGRRPNDPLRYGIRPDGRTAHTDFKLAAWHGGIALFQFDLHTGRTHQIRVHAQAAGFPIVHDDLYGCDDKFIEHLFEVDKPFARRIVACFGRQALHARRVKFVHPFTNEDMVIEAPLPPDFQKAVDIVKKCSRKD